MANTLTPLENLILARAVLHLRERAVMPRAVNSDFAAEAAQFSSTIDVQIPQKWSTQAVTPGTTPTTPVNAAPTTVKVSLDQWHKSDPFVLTDKDRKEIDTRNRFLPMQVEEAVIALANKVNTDIHAEYKGIYGAVGAAATTPFASTAAAATDARKLLHKQLCPRTPRHGVVDFDAEANMLALATFADAEKVGSAEVKIEGEVGRKYGIDWVADDAVATHTTGGGAGWLVNDAAHAIGATTLDIDTGSGDPVVGDIFTVAGDTQQYVVTAYAGGVITHAPAAKVALADNAAITFVATHVANLAFHPMAIAFAMRPFTSDESEGGLGNRIGTVTDPQTGLSLRMEVSRQNKQTNWELDILYGVKLVRPELAVRILG
jgi:hypothetical protein